MADVYLQLSDGTQLGVMDGDLLCPYYGNFSAHLVLADASAAPTGAVTLVWFGTSFSGYSIRSGDNEGRYSCLVVGGNGGFWKTVPSKMYDYRVKANLPLTEILSSVGERLSSKSTPSILAKELVNWPRLTQRCDECLNVITDQIGAVWRVLPDGSVFVGTDSWTNAPDFDYSLQWRDPTWSSATFIMQSVGILPGQRWPAGTLPISNKKVSCVRYQISPSDFYTTVWFADDNGVEIDDPLHAGLVTFVKQTMRYVDFYAEYPAQVVLQRNDGTLDVTPESPKLPPMTSVPVRVPVSGTKIKVNGGDKVNILFENGDPTKYSAQLYVAGSGGRLLARKDGEVNGGTVQLNVVGMVTIGGTYTDGFGTVNTLPPSTSVTFSIKGKILDGWTRWEVTNE